jgi:hypothetical protein
MRKASLSSLKRLQYIKDRTENFDNVFLVERKKERKKCKLKHVLIGFIFML